MRLYSARLLNPVLIEDFNEAGQVDIELRLVRFNHGIGNPFELVDVSREYRLITLEYSVGDERVDRSDLCTL